MAAATLLLPNQTTVVELCVLNKFHFEVEMPTLFVALHSSDNPESKFIRNLESEFAVDEAELNIIKEYFGSLASCKRAQSS